jgi:hypothetical protein
LEKKYFQQLTVSKEFKMVSNGIKLILMQNSSTIAIGRQIMFGFSMAIIILAFASLFLHKMMGV